MHISSRIVKEYLAEKGIYVKNTGVSEQFICGCCYPQPGTSCAAVQNNLLLFDEKNITCMNEFQTASHDTEEFLYVDCSEDPDLKSRVSMEVLALIEEFSHFRESIYEKMLEGDSLQSIIDLMSAKAANPFSLMDQNSFILGRSPGYEKIPSGTIWDTLKGNYLNLYDFYSPAEWKSIRRSIAAAGRSPVLFHPEKDPSHTYLTITLFDKNEMIGSIGAMDNHSAFTDGQLAIMEMIRDLLEIYFRTRYDASRSGKTITDSFNRMINGIYDPNTVAKSLNKRHWHENDVYRILAFDFPDIVATEIELTSIMNLIQLRFSRSMLGIRNKQIILIQQEKESDLTDEANRLSLLAFLKQYDLYCGISYAFPGFSNSRFYCEESAYAASCAVKTAEKESVEHCIFYEAVHVDHLLEAAGNPEDLQRFCHPMIRMLAESEKHSDQVLVECLGSYLLHGKNISAACQELQIHRNTLIYRLQRLREILQIDFDALSGEQLLGFILSCRIAKNLR